MTYYACCACCLKAWVGCFWWLLWWYWKYSATAFQTGACFWCKHGMTPIKVNDAVWLNLYDLSLATTENVCYNLQVIYKPIVPKARENFLKHLPTNSHTGSLSEDNLGYELSLWLWKQGLCKLISSSCYTFGTLVIRITQIVWFIYGCSQSNWWHWKMHLLMGAAFSIHFTKYLFGWLCQRQGRCFCQHSTDSFIICQLCFWDCHNSNIVWAVCELLTLPLNHLNNCLPCATLHN